MAQHTLLLVPEMFGWPQHNRCELRWTPALHLHHPLLAHAGDAPSESDPAAAAAQLPRGFQVLPAGAPHPITFLQLPTRAYGPSATLSSAATDAGVLAFNHPAWDAHGAYSPLTSNSTSEWGQGAGEGSGGMYR